MSAFTPTTTPANVAAPTVRRRGHAALNILAIAASIALLYFGRVFFITLVIAVIIAFLLDPIVTAFLKLRVPRPLASLLVCGLGVLTVGLVGVALYSESAGFIEDLPTYSQRIGALVDNIGGRIDQMEKNAYELVMPKRFQQREQQIENAQAPASRARRRRNTPVPAAPDPTQPAPIPEVRIHAEPKPLLSFAYGYVRSFYDVLLMASFVPFLVYFMLSWRDHMRRSFLYLFEGPERYVAGKSWESIADIARAYVIGNFILGLMLAVISSCFFFAIRLPYWPIVGPLSGFLSLVPYVGLPLAMAPPLIAGLAAYDQLAFYLIIAAVVGILHLLAMNLLYPKVVGARVHLNPLVVTIALMFWGTLWGGIGLVLAIPITAGVKAVCDNVSSLQGYGKLLGD
jgi:predicted PurR-regulated permease PerM